ncbi:MAG: 16S rRNA (cytosine(967)-C(5))-methyltransferase RsmB [Parasporobacterium sp.]|nr:16S rRNA (cytosine(967)-C(5))-methyltransferase RsmB [Parasporobacterium sp.]
METERNIRNIILNMLIRTLEKGEFSHIVINSAFRDHMLSSRERGFINRVYSGTLERLIFLDYVIDSFSSVKTRKMKPVIRNILRMSVYQLKFMDSVPEHSSIDEAVKLARKRGFSNLTGFVNAVLRKICTDSDSLDMPEYIKLSVPEWFFRMVREQYGERDSEIFFRKRFDISEETAVRFNLKKGSPEYTEGILKKEGCRVRRIPVPETAAYISGFGSLTELTAFKEGYIIVQDISSMMAVHKGTEGIQSPELIIDVCAAPGGKSLYAAEKFPEARVISRDITEVKTGLIRENIIRLGVKNVYPEVHDALEKDESLEGRCDIVIADLPCSGLGVTGRKPDILLRVKEKDCEDLAELQRNILSVVQSYLRPGGTLIYSTCTINRRENHDNAVWFTDKYDFDLVSEVQYLQGRDQSDGFYIARLKKHENG